VVIRQSNGYVDAQAPWKLKKEDPARMNTVLYTLAETIRHLALLTQPFMPDASARILDQLSVSDDKRSFSSIENRDVLISGTEMPKPEGVFPRYVEEEKAS
jgi:methionyl-tRNA synthetase